jgi:hypothetical protein
MGLLVAKERFDPADYAAFSERLTAQLEQLRDLLQRPDFGIGAPSLGAEVEMSLVDASGHAHPVNADVLNGVGSGRYTVELDRFNLEYNSLPHPLRDTALSQLGAELEQAVSVATEAARGPAARLALVGILPTLRHEDLMSAAMTDTPRYRALSAALRGQRNAPFRLRIDGEDPLDIDAEDVTFEGAATSLQLHLRVNPGDFARMHNAVQIATAPALAFSGNSPTFLGHRLWDETRIALFKQAVDARTENDPLPRLARVCFGTDWVRQGAHELFEQSVLGYAPLLPVLGDERPSRPPVADTAPELGELRLHHGTVWRWNRAVYDPTGGGHLRIELRALPSGPTVVDMMASAAFLLGLSLDLADEAEAWSEALPFRNVEQNFYRAAQRGPDAELFWLGPNGELTRVPARSLLPALVLRAERGLAAVGVAPSEIDRHLGAFANRAGQGLTGARWQRRRLHELGHRLGERESLHAMFAEYLARSSEGAPIADWKSR